MMILNSRISSRELLSMTSTAQKLIKELNLHILGFKITSRSAKRTCK